MTQTPVQANVVLTADNSQYQQAMGQSAQTTDDLGKSVDTLGAKLERLTKSGGRKILGLTLADVGVITAATAAWASYEKQMQGLNAQAASLSRTQGQQTRVMKDYTSSVTNLRKEFGTTTSAAAQLTQTVSKMVAVGQTSQLTGLTRIFEQMSHATGESSNNLASSVLNLQKVMSGGVVNSHDTREYADTLTYLAARSNTTASSLADFTAQLAPMGKAMGMSGNQVIGLANMFTKAGQEGFTAATAATKVMQDITYATQTGSPDLAKYADVLGVTVEHFKSMSAIEQVAGFFDAVNKEGPKASLTLQKFGFDGIRMSRAIQGAVQSSGGAMNAVREAATGAHSDATAKGADAADNLVNNLAKVRQELEMTAESFARVLGPGVNVVVKAVNVVASAFEHLMSGPFGKFAQIVAAIMIPIGAAAATVLTFASALTKLALVASVFRSSAMLGFREGLRGSPQIVREMIPGPDGTPVWTGGFVGAGGRMLGGRGAQIAEDPRSTWLMRGMYNVGQRPAAALRGAYQEVGSWPFFTAMPGGKSPASVMAGKGISTLGGLYRSQFDQLLYANPADRSTFFQHYFGGRGPDVQAAYEARLGGESKLAGMQAQFARANAPGGVGLTSGGLAELTKEIDAQEKAVKELRIAEMAAVANTGKLSAAKLEETNITKGSAGAMQALSTEAKLAAGALSKAAIAAGGAGLGMAGDVAGKGLRGAGGKLMGALGGAGEGLMAAMNPIMMGMMVASMIGPIMVPLLGKLGDVIQGKPQAYTPHDYGQPLAPYMRTAGTYAPSQATVAAGAPGSERVPTLATAQRVTQSSTIRARAANYKPSDTSFAKMNQDMALSWIATNWDRIQKDPSAIANLRDDLTHYYGAEFAQSTINSFMGGYAAPYTSAPFYQAAGQAQYQLPSGKMEPGTTAMDLATSTERQQLDYLGVRQGAGAMYKAEVVGAGAGLTSYIRRIQQTEQPLSDAAREARLNQLKELYGVNLTPKQIDETMQTLKTGMYGAGGQLLPAQEQGNYFGQGMQTYRAYAGTPLAGEKAMSDIDRLIFTLRLNPNQIGPTLQSYGLDPSLAQTGRWGEAIRGVYSSTPTGRIPDKESIDYRIGQLGAVGKMFERNPQVKEAMSKGLSASGDLNNIPAGIDAVNSMMTSLRDAGLSDPQIIKKMGDIQTTAGSEGTEQYVMASYIMSQAQQDWGMKRQMMTRGQGFAADVERFQSIASIRPVTTGQKAQAQQAVADMGGSLIEQFQYFRQLELMQEQYNIQRDRAEHDYYQQKGWQEQAFQLQRDRQEEDYNRSRERSIAAFHRQQGYAQEDFDTQRRRSEKDFQHSIEVNAKQMAQTAMSIYQRVDVQQTNSATWLLSNAQDQLARIQEQSKNLHQLRRLGLSNAAMQALDLANPANAQEAARLVSEATPQWVAAMNKNIQARTKGMKGLYTDPSNLSYAESNRQFQINSRRSLHDFSKNQDRAETEFQISLKNQHDDYIIMLNRQQKDEETLMAHQQTTYQTSMDRMKEDLNQSTREISGSIESILSGAVKNLHGHARKQAQEVLDTFTKLKTDTSPIAIALMQELAEIFGFKYTPPKVAAGAPAAGFSDTPGRKTGTQIGQAEGGVLPGWSPGRDDRMIPLSGGEAIMRPEWARKVGEKNIDAMNHAAKYGGLAAGGVFRPVNAPVNLGRGIHDQSTGYAALDFSASVGHPIYAVGSGTITRSYDIPGPLPTDSYHDPRYGPFGSYGRVMYLKVDGGPTVLYAHLSKRGYNAGTKVRAGDPIGLTGSAGNSSGPHLHFGDSDGNPWEYVTLNEAEGMFNGPGADTSLGTVTYGRVNRRRLRNLLKDYYPKAERAAYAMQGVHPLDPGQISTVINRYARSKIRELRRSHGQAFTGDEFMGAPPSEIAHSVLAAQKYARSILSNYGWGESQFSPLQALWNRESGWRWNADNPSSSAYGIPQALPGSKMATAGADWRTNASTQIRWGLGYIRDRYGTPAAAWQHSNAFNWYGSGAMFDAPNVIGVGERGPEAVIPLNSGGANFMADVMTHAMGGRNVGRMHGGHGSIYATKIDRSTNFTGPITVQANDPGELMHKLQARQRVMALSRPGLTGSAA